MVGDEKFLGYLGIRDSEFGESSWRNQAMSRLRLFEFGLLAVLSDHVFSKIQIFECCTYFSDTFFNES